MSEGRSSSQSVRALLGVRELILSGELLPGRRISELALVDRLGVSRTPLRAALIRLETEGLVEAIASGGFATCEISIEEIFAAIEVRGAMEGLACRFAAERRLQHSDLSAVREALAAIDELIGRRRFDEAAFAEYVELNEKFHDSLVQLVGSSVIEKQVARANAHPFASPNSFVAMQAKMPDAPSIMIIAQDQHRCIVDAIENHEGGRAEGIAREHARLAVRNLKSAMRNNQDLNFLPGAALLKPTY